MTYTKGKWKHEGDGAIVAVDGKQIASVFPRDREANANLISAAPELYEACTLILSNMRTLSAASTEYKNLFANQIPVMEKALAKAEGVK